MTTWRNFDQRQVLGRSGEFRGSLSGLSPVRAPGAVVPKREKEEAVVEKRLGVDCGSPGKICPITVSESISFLFCDGDRLPASWIWQARRILFGFCKRRTSCLLLQPPWCGRRWQQSRRRGLTTPTPHPQDLSSPGIIAAEAAFINCTPSAVDTGWMLVAIASIDTSATTTSSS